jgi:aspartate/methionine/tyrosine aminotransferase
MYTNLSKISQSASASFADYVRGLESQGRKLIKMQTGDPNFPTHPNIVMRAQEAMAHGQIKYCDSRGMLMLREAIAQKLKDKNKVDANPLREILVTHGAVHAIGLLIRALVEPGDEIILCEPFWRAYQADIVLAGGIVVTVRTDPELGFNLDAEKVMNAATPRTRAIIINSPNNPSGAVYEEEQLRRLAFGAAERSIYLICDEVYENILFGDHQHYSPRSETGVAKWVVGVYSFSKTYAMTGWRIGYLVADEALVDELLKLSQFSVTSLAPFSQIAAFVALKDQEVQEYAEEMRSIYEMRRNLLARDSVHTWLGSAMTLPQGTFYALVDCRELSLPSTELAKLIVDRWGIALTPGIAFGDSMDGYLRICFATSEENVVQALDALKQLHNAELF